MFEKSKQIKFHTAALALVAAGLAISSYLWFGWGASKGVSVARTANLDRGAALYAQACASCHGKNLEGQPNWRVRGPDGRLPAPPHDKTGHTWHHSDRLLLDITLRGTTAVIGGDYKSNMPGFGETYSEEELSDVLAWIKTHWPERERSFQAQVTAEDEAIR